MFFFFSIMIFFLVEFKICYIKFIYHVFQNLSLYQIAAFNKLS